MTLDGSSRPGDSLRGCYAATCAQMCSAPAPPPPAPPAEARARCGKGPKAVRRCPGTVRIGLHSRGPVRPGKGPKKGSEKVRIELGVGTGTWPAR
eukprot:gene15725-biopygen5441